MCGIRGQEEGALWACGGAAKRRAAGGGRRPARQTSSKQRRRQHPNRSGTVQHAAHQRHQRHQQRTIESPMPRYENIVLASSFDAARTVMRLPPLSS